MKLLIFIITLCLSFGCASILKKNYGYNDPAKFTDAAYDQFLQSLNTSAFTSIRSGASEFIQVIQLGKDSLRKNNLGQPIQLLYFNDGNLVSYHANCYAKGTLKGLDWNVDNRFNSFPPASAVAPENFDLKLSDYSRIYPQIKSNKKFTTIMVWSWMLENVSKDAFNEMQKNINEKYGKDSVDVYLINVDEFWKLQYSI